MATNPKIGTITDPVSGERHTIRLRVTDTNGQPDARFYADWPLRPVVEDTYAACAAKMRAALMAALPGEWEDAIRVGLYGHSDALPLLHDTIRLVQVARLPGGGLLVRQHPRTDGRPQPQPALLPPGTTFPGKYTDASGVPAIIIPHTAATHLTLRHMAQVGIALTDAQVRGLESLADGDADGHFNALDAVMQALSEALCRVGVDIIAPEGATP